MPIGLEFPSVLDAARTGAEWAWRVLYRDLAPAVLGYLRARGADSPEDVCGDVFCQLVRDLHDFDGDESGFRSWVFAIAHHRLVDEKRRLSRRPEVPREPAEFLAVAEPRSTEEEALRTESTAEVRELINGLTPDQRDVLLLRVLGGLTVDEVADVLGKYPRAVRSLQYRGLESLRRRVESESFQKTTALTEAS